MDIVLESIIDPSWNLNSAEKEKSIKYLEELLSNEDKDYENYFSSQAISGTIVEDITEIDAQIVVHDKEVRKVLLENKDETLKDILGTNVIDKLNEFQKQLSMLWEIKDDSKTTDSSYNNYNISSIENNKLLEELLNQDFDDVDNTRIASQEGSNSTKKQQENEDEFHQAVHKLRDRINQSKENAMFGKGTSAVVLDNITEVTELMELPFLARTCIKTGHYQEAVMLYTHTKSLLVKFHGSELMAEICKNVSAEITTTMLTGLVKLLSTNVYVNSLKKILKYLAAIPPFDEKDNSALLQVFLSMRYIFIQKEISSFSLDTNASNDTLLEIMIKRKIEVLREFTYTSLNIFSSSFKVQTIDIVVPLAKELDINIPLRNGIVDKKEGNELNEDPEKEQEKKDNSEEAKEEQEEKDDSVDAKKVTTTTTDKQSKTEEDNNTNEEVSASKDDKAEATNEKEAINSEDITKEGEANKKIPTSPFMLQFINECINYLLQDLLAANLKSELSDSVYLQLIYCSFRLKDLNVNYHNLFLNKLRETPSLFNIIQTRKAIQKRYELASRYK